MRTYRVQLTLQSIWEGLRRLYLAIGMGRNPWKSQQKITSRTSVDDILEDGDSGRACSVERFRGVDSKYNEQDGATRNSIQTTLPVDPHHKIVITPYSLHEMISE